MGLKIIYLKFKSRQYLFKEEGGASSLALVSHRALVAPAPLQPRAATIGEVSLLLPLQVNLYPYTLS